MAESISNSVGMQGGRNLHDDVVTVQKLLNGVGPANGGPIPLLKIDGISGSKTEKAIQSFQLDHFGWNGADGRVDPDGQTLAKLNELSLGFSGCHFFQKLMLSNDLRMACQFVRIAVTRLRAAANLGIVMPTSVIEDTRQKVFNIFRIDMVSAPTMTHTHISESIKFTDLVTRFMRLQRGLNQQFPFLCRIEERAEAAAVSNDFRDPTVHIFPRYFRISPIRRSITLVHERSHTVLRIPGHPGTTDSPACIRPHEGFPGIKYEEAIRNAWCYEWLTGSLQPNYSPERFSDFGGCFS